MKIRFSQPSNEVRRDLTVFGIFAALVHVVTVMVLHLDRTWWGTGEPWVLLALLWIVLGWRALRGPSEDA